MSEPTTPQLPKCLECTSPSCRAIEDVANQFLDTLYETIDNDSSRIIAATAVVARLAVELRTPHEQLFHLLIGEMLDIATRLSYEAKSKPALQLVKP